MTKCDNNFLPKNLISNYIIDYLLGKNYHRGKIMCMAGSVSTKKSQM